MNHRALLSAAALLLALSAASCSTIKTLAGITVNQKSVAVAVQSFDAVEVSATQYISLPTCAAGQTTLKNACKSAKVVPTLVADVRTGRAARDSLWAASKAAPNGIGVGAAYNALVAATSSIQTDLAK